MTSTLKDTPGTVICRIPGALNFWVFQNPVEIVSTGKISGVSRLLEKIEGLSKEGKWAAGFISYEASRAFEPATKTRRAGGFPLLWFGIYDKPPEPFDPAGAPRLSMTLAEPEPEIGRRGHLSKIKKIKDSIRDGEIYQANFTFRARGGLGAGAGPLGLFAHLLLSHPAPYAAYVNTGGVKIISNSPELFLSKKGRMITSEPMKGTIKRGLSSGEDDDARKWLANDEKNRAENLMITDMVRNDLGRICRPGGVRTRKLFHVSTYDTLHQMTSLVTGRLRKGVGIQEVMRAAFPAASITGAPKIMATKIISRLERSPRKVYTGAVGCMAPGGDFVFNVAIRTIIAEGDRIEIGVGGGIVADSTPESEWAEALLKLKFSGSRREKFEVLETMAWRKGRGFLNLREHIARAGRSQRYFLRPWDADRVRKSLDELGVSLEEKGWNAARVRLLIGEDGAPNHEASELKAPGWPSKRLRVLVSKDRTDSGNVFLRHKTTNREFYNRKHREAAEKGFDEVVFLNERGELTEGTISNIFVRTKSGWATPPGHCGVLEGIWRSEMIRKLRARERVLTMADLAAAGKILVGNSVRRSGIVKKIDFET